MKIRLLLLLFVFFGCNPIVIEDNKRIIVKGRIVDFNGLPIKEAKVRISPNEFPNRGLFSPPNSYASDSDALAITETNAEGFFSVIALSEENEFVIVEVFKKDKNSKSNNSIPRVVYTYDFESDNLIYDIGTDVIPDFKLVEVNMKNNSGAKNVELTYKVMSKFKRVMISRNSKINDPDNLREVFRILELEKNEIEKVYLSGAIGSEIDLMFSALGEELFVEKILISENINAYEIEY